MEYEFILDSFVTLDRVNNLHSPFKFYKSPEKSFKSIFRINIFLEMYVKIFEL